MNASVSGRFVTRHGTRFCLFTAVVFLADGPRACLSDLRKLNWAAISVCSDSSPIGLRTGVVF